MAKKIISNRAKLRAKQDKKYELNWTPVFAGAVYCSPACGFNCKKSAYDRAVKESKAMVKRLGLGWEARVWENGDWYWMVSRGPVELKTTVYRSYSGRRISYSAWLQHHPQIITNEYETPEKALRMLKKCMVKRVKELSDGADIVRQAMEGL